jgi:membrane protein YdbS with pleckstrin-like domain
MKGRFPSDLVVVVFGPFLVVAVALGFGSLIYHTQQLALSPLTSAVAVVLIVCLLVIFLIYRRRLRVRSSSTNARNESTRTI